MKGRFARIFEILNLNQRNTEYYQQAFDKKASNNFSKILAQQSEKMNKRLILTEN